MITTEANQPAADVAERIPMVDLAGQYRRLKQEIDLAIQEVLSSTRFIKGPVVAAFEEELASYLDGRKALGVASGTDAVQIALMALDIGPGDEVITPAFSFVAAAETIALLGGKPVFAEIDPETFNIDPTHAASLVTERTAAIIPVHLFGQPADLDEIMQVAQAHGIPVIEDAAQAIGSTYKGRRVGYTGRIGCLSFFPSKNLGCYGDGGAVLTNDLSIHKRMTEIASHGAERKYWNNRIGVNSRLDAIQAAVLRVKLRHLESFTKARIGAARRYDQLFEAIPEVTTPVVGNDRSHVYHQYTIRIGGRSAETRDRLAVHLRDRGISTAVYYPAPIYRFDAYADGLRDAAGLPHTERACREIISLPMHTELTSGQQERVVEEISVFLNRSHNA